MSELNIDEIVPQGKASRRDISNSVLRLRFTGVLVFLILLGIVFSILSPRFLSFENFNIIVSNASLLIIAATAEAIVVITRNLDVSIGSTMGLAGYVTANLAASVHGLGPILVLTAVAIGAVLGLVNGVLVAYGKVPSIVATLGTLSIYRGIDSMIAGGVDVTTSQLPKWMLNSVNIPILGIPSLVYFAALIVVVVSLLLRNVPALRQLFAVGSNPSASHFYGLKTKRIVLLAYVSCGFLAGLSGFLYAAQIGEVTVVLARGWELETLAAVVIGGVSILGGSGSLFGVALGAIVLATIDNGLVLLRVQEFWRMFVQGTAIVLAVAVDAMVDRRVKELLKTRRFSVAAGGKK